jgi:hypothetical protein
MSEHLRKQKWVQCLIIEFFLTLDCEGNQTVVESLMSLNECSLILLHMDPDSLWANSKKNYIVASNFVIGDNEWETSDRDMSLFDLMNFWETVKIILPQISVHNWWVQNAVVILPKKIGLSLRVRFHFVQLRSNDSSSLIRSN